MRLLEVRKLTKTFEDADAVRDVSLSVEEGASLGLVGESGSGKSTLARMIMQMIPPTSGEIFFEGRPISRLSPRERRAFYASAQMIFQDPFSAFPPRMSIGTFLTEGLVHHRHMSRRDAQREMRGWMERLGLDAALWDRLPHELSGGQLQRCAIARALSVAPKLVVLDEATGALDVSVQRTILELLAELKERYSLTYLTIGHDLAVVRALSSRIAIMYAGRVVEILPADHIHEGLHPYTKSLLQASLTLDDVGKKKLRLNELSAVRAQESGCPYAHACPNASGRCIAGMPSMTTVGAHEVMCFLYS